jgi:hypothetical protein
LRLDSLRAPLYECGVRLLIRHDSRYEYGESTALGPHIIRLRPAVHAKARVESYALRVSPQAELCWQ